MKRIFSLMLALTAMFAMTGCSGDDKEDDGGNGGGGGNNNPIVAKWKYHGWVENGNIEPDTSILDCEEEFYQFKSSGKVTITEEWCDEADDVFTVDYRLTENGTYLEILAQGEVFEEDHIYVSEDGKYLYWGVQYTDGVPDLNNTEVWKKI